MCLFSHQWKINSSEDVAPLVETSEHVEKLYQSGTKIPAVYFERKLKIHRECAVCGTEEVKIVRVDP